MNNDPFLTLSSHHRYFDKAFAVDFNSVTQQNSPTDIRQDLNGHTELQVHSQIEQFSFRLNTFLNSHANQNLDPNFESEFEVYISHGDNKTTFYLNWNGFNQPFFKWLKFPQFFDSYSSWILDQIPPLNSDQFPRRNVVCYQLYRTLYQNDSDFDFKQAQVQKILSWITPDDRNRILDYLKVIETDEEYGQDEKSEFIKIIKMVDIYYGIFISKLNDLSINNFFTPIFIDEYSFPILGTLGQWATFMDVSPAFSRKNLEALMLAYSHHSSSPDRENAFQNYALVFDHILKSYDLNIKFPFKDLSSRGLARGLFLYFVLAKTEPLSKEITQAQQNCLMMEHESDRELARSYLAKLYDRQEECLAFCASFKVRKLIDDFISNSSLKNHVKKLLQPNGIVGYVREGKLKILCHYLDHDWEDRFINDIFTSSQEIIHVAYRTNALHIMSYKEFLKSKLSEEMQFETHLALLDKLAEILIKTPPSTTYTSLVAFKAFIEKYQKNEKNEGRKKNLLEKLQQGLKVRISTEVKPPSSGHIKVPTPLHTKPPLPAPSHSLQNTSTSLLLRSASQPTSLPIPNYRNAFQNMLNANPLSLVRFEPNLTNSQPLQPLNFEIPPLINFLKNDSDLCYGRLIDSVERAWFQDVPQACYMINQLIENRLTWSFPATDDMLAPLAKFLIEMQSKRQAALAIAAHYIDLFQLTTNKEGNPEILKAYRDRKTVNAYDVLYSLINFVQNKRAPLLEGRALDPIVCKEVAYTVLCAKWQEIKSKVFFYKTQKREFPDANPKEVNCFILAQDGPKARVFLTQASFDKKSTLLRWTASENVQQNLFALIEKTCPTSDNQMLTLTEEEIKKFDIKIKNFIVLHRVLPPFSLTGHASHPVELDPMLIEENMGSEKSHTPHQSPILSRKRKMDEIEVEPTLETLNLEMKGHLLDKIKPSGSTHRGNLSTGYQAQGGYVSIEDGNHASKKRRLNDQTEKGLSIPSVGMSSTLGQINYDPINFWECHTAHSLTTVTMAVSRENKTYQLLVENKVQTFPILSKINEIQPLDKFNLLNPLLMPYQRDTVKNVLTALRSSVSKIIALEMGLGKSFVILELIVQTILEGSKGPNLILVPVSLHNQMHEEAVRYMEEVKCMLLKWLLESELGLHLVQDLISELKTDLQNILNQCEKELTETKKKDPSLGNATAEELKGYLRRYSILKRSGIFTFETTISAKLTLALKKMMVSSWESLNKKVASIPEKAQSLQHSLVKLFKTDLAGYQSIIEKTQTIDFSLLFNKIPSQKHEKNGELLLFICGLILDLNPDRNELKNLQVDQQKRFEETELLPLLRYPSIRKIENLEPSDFNGSMIGIVKTSTLKQISAIPKEILEKTSSVFVDEAHNFTQENLTTKQMKIFLEKVQRKILVTGTPINLNYNDLRQLIELANPGAFSQGHLKALDKLIDDFPKVFLDPKMCLENAEEIALRSFAHFYHMNTILQKLLVSIRSDHPQVLEDWGGRVPSAEYHTLHVKVPNPDLFEKATDLFRSSIANHSSQEKTFKGQIFYEKKIKRLLLHPALEGLESDALKNKITFFDPKNIHKWIEESAMFKPFYKDANGKFGNELFQNCVDEKKKGVIIIDQKIAAQVGKIVLEASGDIEAFIYEGCLKASERKAILERFKSNENEGINKKAKILLLMIKAGGVGLNIPEADYVFVASESYSIAAELQAIARAKRVGHVGRKFIVKLAYNIFLSQHISIINLKKEHWIALILGKQDFLNEKFACWLKIGELTAKQSVLNQKKDIDKSQDQFQEIEAIAQKLKEMTSMTTLTNYFDHLQIPYQVRLDDSELDDELDLLMQEL